MGRNLHILFLAVFIGWAGCTDAVLDVGEGARPDPTQSQPTKVETTKLRHAHLLDHEVVPGKLLEHYSELATSTEFVVGARATVLDMNKLVEHYGEEEGVTVKRSYGFALRGFALHVDSAYVESVLLKMEDDDRIAWVEPDAKVKKKKPKFSQKNLKLRQQLPWGIKRIGTPKSSTKAGDHKGEVPVDVYVLDTGVGTYDLQIVEEVDFTGSTVEDAVGHGTHVAGVLAAEDDHDGVVGAAPAARVHSLKVLDDNGKAELSTVIAAVDYITEQKQRQPDTPMVVNISFGGKVNTATYNALDETIQNSIAQGVVYVIAAGNDGKEAWRYTPAHVEEAITVGAYDEKDRYASFSNYGPLVDLLAPGVDILSVSYSKKYQTFYPALMSGTSVAVPHVTGAAALYLSRNRKATPQEVRDALLAYGRDFVSGAPEGTTGRSVYVEDF